MPNRHSGDFASVDEDRSFILTERQLVIEKKKSELLRLNRKMESLTRYYRQVGNCVPNNVFDVDYRALELENVSSNQSLVQSAEEHKIIKYCIV